MNTLAEFLKAESPQLRTESGRRKSDKLDWQKAVESLVEQVLSWVTGSDPDDVLQYRRVPHRFDDYDVGGDLILPGLLLILGESRVELIPNPPVPVVGVIQLPGEEKPRKIDGRAILSNGVDRVPLYFVKEPGGGRWYWWTHGGKGRPFDRASFEETLVGLLQ